MFIEYSTVKPCNKCSKLNFTIYPDISLIYLVIFLLRFLLRFGNIYNIRLLSGVILKTTWHSLYRKYQLSNLYYKICAVMAYICNCKIILDIQVFLDKSKFLYTITANMLELPAVICESKVQIKHWQFSLFIFQCFQLKYKNYQCLEKFIMVQFHLWLALFW